MRMVLVGYKHNEGIYEGRAYENYKLHLVNPNPSSNMIGQESLQVKVNPVVFKDFIKGKTDEMILNQHVNIEFGMNNVVQAVQLVK